MSDAQNLIWVDLEMTGLIPEQHRVIEMATIVTDSDLNELAQGPVIAIHQSQGELDAMDEWNTTHHNRSGISQYAIVLLATRIIIIEIDIPIPCCWTLPGSARPMNREIFQAGLQGL